MIFAQENGATSSVEESVNAVNSWWDDPTTREWLVAKPLHILAVILIALILQWVLRRVINRFASHYIENGGGPALSTKLRNRIIGQPAASSEADSQEQERRLDHIDQARETRRRSRVRTLARVLSSTGAIIIWAWVVLDVLSTLGINVGPIIASAGVVGLAVGFGAQSLIKDYIAGIFMLLEDQYGVGDEVVLDNGVSGTVEDITLRITSVRDIDGTLWYVRNGEVLYMGNNSAGYGIARMQIPVGLTADATEAWQVVHDAALAAAQSETIRNAVIEEPATLGVSEFNPDHLSYRVTIKTMPGEQWRVQRHVQGYILDEMNKKGIPTPYPYGIPRAGIPQTGK
ncbi:small-conductance mechanosensitive channel [Corynebacterium uterequi]|uniref:Small-conductance mechanosensitive channel n=2 Tax=Corynebacterium uterequi TaxID=1072256 RepID=A0A0G3HKQ9_9CORY|nr:small-conductance mechanosensitive channel [Corynebacterium uterequi]